MRRWPVVALAVLCLSAAEPPVARWQALNRAARAAREAKDYTAFREDLLQLFELASGHPRIVYNLAVAEVQSGHPDAALDWLRTWAEMGLTHDVAADADFNSLHQSPAFAQILKRVEENRKPVSRASIALTMPERDLLTEDVTYDPATKTFYVSSVRHRKILAIDRQGAVREFVKEGQDGVWSILAVAVDAKRRLLWASTAAMAQAAGYVAADAGRSAILKYDLRTGRLLKRYDLLREGNAHVLGDMTVSPAGDVYAGDGAFGAVYTIQHDRDVLEVLVGPGEMASPQTPALTPDGRRLFVADYTRGIAVIDLASRAVSWLPHPRGIAMSGIDGLYLTGNTLVAVQNGTSPMRIIRMRLDRTLSRVEGWETMESNGVQLGVPTHGVLVEGEFTFIGNSGWDRFADDGQLNPGAVFEPPLLLKMRLNQRDSTPR